MEDFPDPEIDLEIPLEGLISKPMHLMSEEELREKVQKLHEYRTNSQSLRAALNKEKGVKKEKERVDTQTKSLFDSIDEINEPVGEDEAEEKDTEANPED